ncbi:hypothetical protein ACFQH8_19215 [Halomicroarcula sp. GCM10025710]
MSESEEPTERGADFATESLEKWTPRFVANGIDYNDLARLQERIDDWSDWCSEFAAIGDEHEALGTAALDRGTNSLPDSTSARRRCTTTSGRTSGT